MTTHEFHSRHFRRRQFSVQGSDLDRASKIEVIVKADGKPFIRAQLREPGLLAIVSRPDSQGIDVEWVELAGPHYSDRLLPGATAADLAPWQAQALGLD